MKGKLIIFDGFDEFSKIQFLKKISKYLVKKYSYHVVTFHLYDSAVIDNHSIFEILSDTTLSYQQKLTLYRLAVNRLLEEYIQPALDKNHIVLLDRLWTEFFNLDDLMSLYMDIPKESLIFYVRVSTRKVALDKATANNFGFAPMKSSEFYANIEKRFQTLSKQYDNIYFFTSKTFYSSLARVKSILNKSLKEVSYEVSA